ncbi:MAG TPA: MBL fold metallo-hydrolase [Anaerolineales bacterium]|nr:MBL fold metallo-hydrolase [Anaerolineales bacterium]
MQFHTLDLHFLNTPQVIASYVLVGSNSVALIETGPGSTLPNLLNGLRDLGIKPADVRDVLVTHIHLDHAGAAGWWARQGATVHVHPFGAPHLIDPSKLLLSAKRIYGDLMDPLWGEFLSSPADKVHIVKDCDVLNIAGVEVHALDTPGHALHHHTYRIGDIAFTGDSAGVRLMGFDMLALPTPPPEFDLEAWQRTIARLAALNLSRIYPTHFGEVADPADHFRQLAPLLNAAAEIVRAGLAEGLNRDQIIERFTVWYLARAGAAGLDEATRERYAKVNNLPMCVDGMLRYWGKKPIVK